MKAFVKAMKKAGYREGSHDMFAKWLMLITQNKIKDKDAIKNICTEGELKDAMKTLIMMSRNKHARHAYQRRMDEIYFHNKDQAEKEAALAKKDAIIAEKEAALADKDSALADTYAALADKDAIIAELKAELDKRK